MATVALLRTQKPLWHKGEKFSPSGIRTRVTGVRGRHPRPLDDGAAKLPGMELNHRHADSESAVLPLNYPGPVATVILHDPRRLLQPAQPGISAAVGRRLAMAVRAKHP